MVITPNSQWDTKPLGHALSVVTRSGVCLASLDLVLGRGGVEELVHKLLNDFGVAICYTLTVGQDVPGMC